MSAETVNKKRPKHLNVFLLGIQLPFPGMVSIFHRVTGAGLFIMLGFVIWLFDQSLASESDFQNMLEWLRNPIVLLISFGLLWAFIFHFFAGIRYLFLDLDIGVDLKYARLSSFAVAGVSSMVSALVFFLVLLALFPALKEMLPL